MTSDPNTFKTGPFSYEVHRLVDAGLEVKPDEVWTFSQMSELLGVPVDGRTASLQEALRRLSRDHGREFRNIRKVGYLALSDAAIVECGPGDRRTIHRRVKRAAQRTGNIRQWEELTDAYKREADTHRSIIGLLRHVLRPSSIKRIRSEVDRERDALDLNETLRLFRGTPKSED